jgi:hypothetical protein
VSEELRLDQRLWQGGTVERDERALGARAGAMDHAGQDLLAAPAFAGEEHRGARARDLSCVVQSRPESRRPADDRVAALDLDAGVAHLGRVTDAINQSFDIDRDSAVGGPLGLPSERGVTIDGVIRHHLDTGLMHVGPPVAARKFPHGSPASLGRYARSS